MDGRLNARSERGGALTSRWTRLRALSWSDRLTLGRALVGLPLTALSLRLLGFQWSFGLCGSLARLRSGRGPFEAADRRDRGRAVAGLVAVAATRGPYRATCLPRALVVWSLLRAEAIDATLWLGVRKKDDATLDAHAWVEVEGCAVTDGADVDQRYLRLGCPPAPATIVGAGAAERAGRSGLR